jgi:hypothetical protein
MKKILAVLALILLGVGLGLGVTWWRVKTAAWNRKPYENVEIASVPAVKPGQPAPKAFIEKTDFDFGVLDIAGEGTHDFTVANRGVAPLRLTAGETSCRCAVSKLERETIGPGESAKVTITWKPKGTTGPYRQTAKIKTNDPALPAMTLTISGKITVAAEFVPPEMVFSELTVGGSATAQSRLYCNLAKPLKILGHRWDKAETARLFDVALAPLPADDVAARPGARSGTLVTVTARPGLQQGPFKQKLILETDLKAAAEQALPIQGRVEGDITVAGADWDYAYNLLNIGAVPSGESATRRLLLMVRGPHRKDVTFKAAQANPNFLKVSIGKSTEINHGAVVQTPVTIEVPAGSPVCSHLGASRGDLGTFDLETTHPQVPRLRVLVRFAVEE